MYNTVNGLPQSRWFNILTDQVTDARISAFVMNQINKCDVSDLSSFSLKFEMCCPFILFGIYSLSFGFSTSLRIPLSNCNLFFSTAEISASISNVETHVATCSVVGNSQIANCLSIL